MTSAQAARQITVVPIVQERGMRCNLVITTAKAVSASTPKFMEQASLWTRYARIASHVPGGPIGGRRTAGALTQGLAVGDVAANATASDVCTSFAQRGASADSGATKSVN